MAYGSPRDLGELRAYYTHIRHGQLPTPDELAELQGRYEAIGGTSPFRSITEAQACAIAEHLGPGFRLSLGYKHSDPSIEDAVAELADAGVRRIIGLVLAPHFSRASIGEYAGRAADASRSRGVDVQVIESWHLLPAYIDFLSGAVRDVTRADSDVIFTAHSLPVHSAGEIYAEQLRDTAAAVAERANLSSWCIAFQSAGRRGEWLGPDVPEVMRERIAAGTTSFVVCPCGFVADHLEIRYDLDVVVAELARGSGVAFRRTSSVNDDANVMRALADLIRQHAE